MTYALIKQSLKNNGIPIWELESKPLDWVVEIQAAKRDEPLRLVVNYRLNLEAYRADIEDALRQACFTYRVDPVARTFTLVH
jgi:hypothetical protein